MKNIYIVFSCDEWKSKDSMRLLTASTSGNKLINVIRNEIVNSNMEFQGLPQKRVIKAFDNWIKTEIVDVNNLTGYDIERINTVLNFGFIEIVQE